MSSAKNDTTCCGPYVRPTDCETQDISPRLTLILALFSGESISQRPLGNLSSELSVLTEQAGILVYENFNLLVDGIHPTLFVLLIIRKDSVRLLCGDDLPGELDR